MMKKLLIGLVVLIVLAVAAVLIGPSFVDWSRYKDQIAQQARQATGRELAIDGGISLSILPAPKLSVEKVRLSNIEGGSAPDMASLGSLEVRVAFAPFDWYNGNFQITRIDLVEPTILLERLADGRTNWTFASKEGEAAPSTTSGGSAPAIRLDNVTIQDGTLIYRDAASGSEQKVTALNATLGAESLSGPFRAEGSLTYGALPVLFKVAAGALGGDRPAEIDAELGLAKSDAMVKFAGTVATAPALAVKGKLDAGTGNLATTLNALAPGSAAGLPLALDKVFKVAGDVAYADTGGGVQNLAVSLDDMTATGAVNFTPGTPAKAEAKLALNRLDLDKLLAAAAAAPAEQAAPAAPSAGGGFALPADLDASLELGIDAIAYKGGVVNDAELKAELSKGELNLTKASALLPGGSSFSIAGTLAAAEGQPKFTGALEGKSDNLRGLLEWLQVALPQVPADRLRQLALTSRVNATPGTVEIADLDLTLDSSRITGGTTIALPGANRAKPAFGVGLAIDQINVDGYLPPAAAAAPQPAAAETKSAGLPLDGLKPLADIDANVELRVGKLTVNEQTLQGVHVDGLLQGGNLTLRDLSVKEFAGGKGALSGTVTGLATQPRFDTKFNLSAKDAGRAFQLAGLGKTPGQLGALKLDGTLAGGAQDVAYDVTFSIAGVGAQGAAKGKATGIGAGIPRVDTTFNLQAKDAGPLFGLAGLSAADGSKLGAVAINGTAQSGANDLAYDVSLSAAGIGGQGKLTGKLTELTGTPKVDTRLDFNAQKPAPILALAGMAGPTASKAGALGVSGTMAGNADSMKLDLDLNGFGGGASLDGTVSAAKAPTSFDLALTANHPEFRQLLSALVAGYQPSATQLGAFSLKAKANGSTQLATLSGLSLQAGQTRLDGDLKLDQTKAKPFLTANLKGGVVDVTPFTPPPAKSQKTASGGQRWSNEPLDLSALDSFDADVDFTADSFISGTTRIDNLKTKLSLRDGTLTIAQLNGNTYGGAVDLTGQLVSRGVPTFTGKVVADKVSVSDLAGTGLAKGPVSFNADVQSRGRSMAELMGGLQGKGRVDGTVTVLGKLEQAVGAAALGVAGQQLAKLTGITQVQSVTGYLNAAYQAFVGRPNALTGDFTIARGVLNTQNLTLANDQAKALATGDANLSAWTIAMLVNLFSAQFPDQPCLKVDLAGILDSPTPKPRGGGGCGGSAATGTTNVLGGFGQLLGGAIPGTAPAGQAVSPTDAIGGAVGGALGGALGGILGGKKKDSGAATQPQAPATTKKVAPAQQQPQAPAATAPAQQQPQTPATGRKKNQQTAPAAPAQQPPAAVTPPPAEAAPEQPAAPPPATEQPAPEQPAAEQPAPEQPAPEQPAAEQPAPAQPAAEQPAPAQPAPEQPAPEPPPAEQPAPAQPAPEQPAQPAPEQPAQPAPEQPATEQPPAAEQPTVVPPTEEQQQQQ
jgi:uncharacterized protein involved in outer membrane biogenesis